MKMIYDQNMSKDATIFWLFSVRGLDSSLYPAVHSN